MEGKGFLGKRRRDDEAFFAHTTAHSTLVELHYLARIERGSSTLDVAYPQATRPCRQGHTISQFHITPSINRPSILPMGPSSLMYPHDHAHPKPCYFLPTTLFLTSNRPTYYVCTVLYISHVESRRHGQGGHCMIA